jgi:hypothetical protein
MQRCQVPEVIFERNRLPSWRRVRATGRAIIAPALKLAPLVLTMAVVSTLTTTASAEVKEADVDHTLIIGVGGAGELEIGDGSLHPGANVMIEWDAIENWLELEVGASVLSAPGGVQVPIDVLVKKPFKLARWAEFMIGVGPEVVQVTGANKGTYLGGEVALDFMFWPWGRHVGIWLEPEYDLTYQHRVACGIGSTGGVLFGW